MKRKRSRASAKSRMARARGADREDQVKASVSSVSHTRITHNFNLLFDRAVEAGLAESCEHFRLIQVLTSNFDRLLGAHTRILNLCAFEQPRNSSLARLATDVHVRDGY